MLDAPPRLQHLGPKFGYFGISFRFIASGGRGSLGPRSLEGRFMYRSEILCAAELVRFQHYLIGSKLYRGSNNSRSYQGKSAVHDRYRNSFTQSQLELLLRRPSYYDGTRSNTIQYNTVFLQRNFKYWDQQHTTLSVDKTCSLSKCLSTSIRGVVQEECSYNVCFCVVSHSSIYVLYVCLTIL